MVVGQRRLLVPATWELLMLHQAEDRSAANTSHRYSIISGLASASETLSGQVRAPYIFDNSVNTYKNILQLPELWVCHPDRMPRYGFDAAGHAVHTPYASGPGVPRHHSHMFLSDRHHIMSCCCMTSSAHSHSQPIVTCSWWAVSCCADGWTKNPHTTSARQTGSIEG